MDHRYFMELALQQAEQARAIGEVPVGAVIVLGEQVIAKAHNQKEALQNPLAHAELLAIHGAAKQLNTWRLAGTTMYVTLEPCVMCTGALIQARVDTLVYGASDLKGGACGTCFNLAQSPLLNHQLKITAGVMEEECSLILQDFFKEVRKRK